MVHPLIYLIRPYKIHGIICNLDYIFTFNRGYPTFTTFVYSPSSLFVNIFTLSQEQKFFYSSVYILVFLNNDIYNHLQKNQNPYSLPMSSFIVIFLVFLSSLNTPPYSFLVLLVFYPYILKLTFLDISCDFNDDYFILYSYLLICFISIVVPFDLSSYFLLLKPPL